MHALASPQPTSPRHISPPISKVSHNPESWAHLFVHRRKLPCMCNVEENVVCIGRFTEGGRKVVMIYSLDSGLIPPTINRGPISVACLSEIGTIYKIPRADADPTSRM